MITLALDSSGKTASVCIMQGEAVLYAKLLDEGLTHSQTLLPLVQEALAACQLPPGDVGLYAVTVGPGSFTGLRIGLSLIKGLALPHNTPVVGVSTLRAYAAAEQREGIVLPALDARRGEVYWAAFDCSASGCTRLHSDTASPASQAAGWLGTKEAADAAIVGDGAEICYNVGVYDKLGSITAKRLPSQPVAFGAAVVALQKWRQGEAVQAGLVNPAYLRLSQAQRERAQRLAQQKEGDVHDG